jgi:hypothetical protein
MRASDVRWWADEGAAHGASKQSLCDQQPHLHQHLAVTRYWKLMRMRYHGPASCGTTRDAACSAGISRIAARSGLISHASIKPKKGLMLKPATQEAIESPGVRPTQIAHYMGRFVGGHIRLDARGLG